MSLMMREACVALFLLTCLWSCGSNRVYVHPFYLFAPENVSCEVIQTYEARPLETVSPAPLQASMEADPRPAAPTGKVLVNITQRTAVLAELQNRLGLRMYQALSSTQRGANTLLSPTNNYGALVTLCLGAATKTALSYQQLLGLNMDSKRTDCVYLIDGYKVLQTLQAINSLIDGPRDELQTLVWTFVRADAELAKDFVRGTQDFSDTSYIRGVDFSQPGEAEEQVNSFMQKTSGDKVKHLFKGVTSATNLLFASSVHFKGNWRKAFQPEATSMQEFWIDHNSTVTVPLMTHTGDYKYLNDKGRRCMVVKLGLSKRTYMLLVLPHEGASLHDIESQLNTDDISTWYQHLKPGFLELSLPKFSMTAVTDLRAVLSAMKIENYLLGSDANFQRLSTKENFTVDKVFSKVVFEMSEEGTETQTRTEDGRNPLKVTVNRPFFFAVVEGNSNAILMLGKVINPAL